MHRPLALACLLVAGAAQVGRPLQTEDAGLLDARACELEGAGLRLNEGSKCEIPTSDAGCPPKTCEDAGVSCGGPIPDGCGGLVASSSCGACTGNFACKDGACVKACTPLTCNAAGAQCGYAADGCGGVIDCGVCPDGFSCGHAQPFQCGNVQP
jgi:hypothetical protein